MTTKTFPRNANFTPNIPEPIYILHPHLPNPDRDTLVSQLRKERSWAKLLDLGKG